jgi:hypothetical protein
MADTPTARKVRLKRVEHLKRGDAIRPGEGLFLRDGSRIVSRLAMSDTWTMSVWFVADRPWMNEVPELVVPLDDTTGTGPSDYLHTPLDAYVVLA